jgi:cobyrinic acid a,c-diamide synthase
VPISALETSHLPEIDVLYIGGGFPEMYADGLAQNASLRHQIRHAVEDGLPVYAECGGLMYLGESLRVNGREYPMLGALPLVTEFLERPQGHGYTRLETIEKNPFFPVETWLRGHEFHYSRVLSLDDSKVRFAFRVHRGTGVDGRREGIVRRNVLAAYTHLHAIGCDAWGEGIARRAGIRRRDRHQGMAMGAGLH